VAITVTGDCSPNAAAIADCGGYRGFFEGHGEADDFIWAAFDKRIFWELSG
jgi:hypothetical protein